MILFVILGSMSSFTQYNSAVSQEWLHTEELKFLWILTRSDRYLESLSHFLLLILISLSIAVQCSIKIKDYKTPDNQGIWSQQFKFSALYSWHFQVLVCWDFVQRTLVILLVLTKHHVMKLLHPIWHIWALIEKVQVLLCTLYSPKF